MVDLFELLISQFRKLFESPDPTRGWPPYAGQSLTIDIKAGTLNGAAIGKSLESASFLGPVQQLGEKQDSMLCYFSQGLSIVYGGTVDAIEELHVVLRDPDEPRYRPFTGSVLAGGVPLDLSTMSQADFLRRFGDCYWMDEDDKETILFYEFGSLEWQVEFDLRSAFKRITVTNTPLLADAGQRAAYNVTKAWPPES